ncbi:hypothetical protein VTN96DRAFT_3340 [Rasamsonia emersonii]
MASRYDYLAKRQPIEALMLHRPDGDTDGDTMLSPNAPLTQAEQRHPGRRIGKRIKVEIHTLNWARGACRAGILSWSRLDQQRMRDVNQRHSAGSYGTKPTKCWPAEEKHGPWRVDPIARVACPWP